ncbi:MAG TPA: hypothetical protein VFF39_05990 [Verrucomicrobiae bacterium]|nr:hypothetical protein [Verrucomicrobiae bacterium]
MPFSYVVYKKHRLVVGTGTGRVTYDEIKARQDQTKGDPDFNSDFNQSDFNQIVDLRAATTVDLTVDQPGSSPAETSFPPHPCALSSPQLLPFSGWDACGSSYTEIAQETSQIRIFSNLLSAIDWLGLKDKVDFL